MTRFHRSKWPAGLAALVAVAAACAKDPHVTTRTVTMHTVCTPGGVTLDGGAYALFYGLGDFEPAAALGAHDLGSDLGAVLSEIDPRSVSLFVDASENEREWWGVTDVPSAGNLDVLLVPALTSCAFSQSVDAGTMPAVSGAVLASVSPEQVLVVGGVVGSGAAGTPSPTLVVHLDTGGVEPVTQDRDLRTPRIRASVTIFGEGALVAGGADPRMSSTPLTDAEVYDPAVGGFDQQNPILLSEPRADQGAVVLASGVTLLVGGTGADGSVLGSMEIVDPATRTVRTQGIASLASPRRLPTVLLLASGDVLVAGGVDASGAPVTTMELFSGDASRELTSVAEPVAGGARAYAALASGGALFVVAPGAGADATFQSVWLLDPDGVLEDATPIEGALTQPVLFGGAGDAPALWTGDRWLRWQPWTGAFGALGSLDDTPPNVGTVVVSPDSGLAMWLDTSDPTASTVTALRFDTRGEYSTLAGPLLTNDTNDVAPDRLPSAGGLSFDPSQGLTLGPGASAFVTDRTYADVAIDVDVPAASPAWLVLRDGAGNEVVVGTGADEAAGGCSGSPSPSLPPACCPVPSTGTAATLEVKRTGATVAWSVTGVGSGTCAATVDASARLSIGVRGAASSSPSVARNLRITRTGAS